MNRLHKILIAILSAAFLAACGAAGKPEPPPGAKKPDPDREIVLDPLIRER
ncbi:hypothetical protein [Thermopetrobacter sp. TC1]|uniref:hypothetical protein n=1 Tax=Thermopetrobacter sp. TC1 TaxID=1495045 RepID=UPI0018CDDB2A|nr:hypothetical protein [Thermopetrobacter sp. TC1]